MEGEDGEEEARLCQAKEATPPPGDDAEGAGQGAPVGRRGKLRPRLRDARKRKKKGGVGEIFLKNEGEEEDGLAAEW